MPAVSDTRDLCTLEICQPASLMFFLHIGTCCANIVLLTGLLRDDEDVDMSAPGMTDITDRELEDAYEKRLTAAKKMSSLVKIVWKEGLPLIYGDIGGLVRSSRN